MNQSATARPVPVWICRWSSTLLLLALVTFALPALAEEQKAEGSGSSYWGPIPDRSQSELVTSTNNSRPLWEKIYYGPHWIATRPIVATAWVIGSTIEGVDRTRIVQRVRELLYVEVSNFQARLNFALGGEDGTTVGMSGVVKNFFGEGNGLKLSGRYSTLENSKATLGMLFGAGSANLVQVGVGYRNKPNARFYLPGPESTDDVFGFYTEEVSWGGISWERELGSNFSALVGGLYSTSGTRGPRRTKSENPPLEDVFGLSPSGPQIPFGYSERSDGFSFSLGMSHKNVDAIGRPSRGGIRDIKANYFSSNDDSDVSFWTYRANVEQFVPLWFTRRALALRATWARIGNQGDDPVPFQRLLSNDESDEFRGFRDLRWRDTGLLSFNSEYRWPVWNLRDMDNVGLDAYLFTDYGQVYGKTAQISMDNMQFSWGGGLRLVTTPGFLGRFEVALSDEETIIRLRGEQLFNFSKNGLYYGRNPVPTR